MYERGFALIALPLALLMSAVPVDADECRPIIDVHLHFYTDENFWGPTTSRATGEESPDTAATHREATLREMERNGIVLALASAPLDWTNRDPELLWHSVEAEHPDEIDPKELRAAIEEGRVRAIGEIGAQYQGLSPTDPRWTPLWELAEEYGLPVAIHTGGGPRGTARGSRTSFRYEMGDPLLLQDLLVEHPKLKVSMMHAGLDLYLDETLAMMHMYPDLYADIGVAAWVMPHMRRALDEFLEEAVARGYGERILFGTDQMVWPGAIPIAIETIRTRDYLTDAQKRDLLFENAVRFLGLGEEERERLIAAACGSD